MCDDMSDDSEPESILAERSWTKHVKDIKKDGYRQGLEVGQEESLQEGFNQAFPVAAKVLRSVAHVRGLISGKLSVNLLNPGFLTGEQESKLQELLQDVLDVETKMLTFPGPRFTDWTRNPESHGTNVAVKVSARGDSTVKNTCGGRLNDVLNVAEGRKDDSNEQMGDSKKSSDNTEQIDRTTTEKGPHIKQVCGDVHNLLQIKETGSALSNTGDSGEQATSERQIKETGSPLSDTGDSGEQATSEPFVRPGKTDDLQPIFQQQCDTEPDSLGRHCSEVLGEEGTRLDCLDADIERLRERMNTIMSAVS